VLIDVNYIFGVLTSRTNDWYINESNSEWVGGVGWDFGGVLHNYTGPLPANV
jgi:hypothetical protein